MFVVLTDSLMQIQKLKRIICLLCMSLLSIPVWSQEKDFGIWYGADIKHEILKNLNIEVSAMLRTFRNAGKTEQIFIEAGPDYKINDFLSVAGSYRLTSNLEDDERYHLQHKLFLDLKGTVKVTDIDLTLRLRFQTRFKTWFEDEDDKIPDYNARIRLKGTYKTPSFPLNPFIYAETFMPLFVERDRVTGKYRLSGGVEFSIAKHHTIDAGYIFQRDYFPDLRDENIISAGYTFRF